MKLLIELKSLLLGILGSEDLEDLLEEMIVDDKREHVLTKFATTKGAMKKVESDHNPLFANFSIKYKPKKTEVRREIFDFKDKESQKKYLRTTNNLLSRSNQQSSHMFKPFIVRSGTKSDV